MTLLLPFLLLTTTPSLDNDLPNYCQELSVVLAQAVKDEVITDKEAGGILNGCYRSRPKRAFSFHL